MALTDVLIEISDLGVTAVVTLSAFYIGSRIIFKHLRKIVSNQQEIIDKLQSLKNNI